MTDYMPTTDEVRGSLVFLNKHYAEQRADVDVDLLVVESETAAQFDRWLAEVERAAAARALEEVANDLRVSFSRGAAIAMHHQCHKKQCRCGNPGNDEIVRAVFDAAREEFRARAEAYRQERGEQWT